MVSCWVLLNICLIPHTICVVWAFRAVLGQRWRQQSPIDQDQDQGRLDCWFWEEEKDMPSIAEC